MQIPAGGNPQTTSVHRPTFEEIGIRDTIFYDVGFDMCWERFGLYGNAEIDHMHGSSVLKEQLISHGVVLPPGTHIDVTAIFDWYKFGAMYGFRVKNCAIAPTFEVAVLDFGYYFRTSIEDSRRSFRATTYRFGLKGEYDLSCATSLVFEGAFSIPHRLAIYDVSAKLASTFYENRCGRFDWFVGIGMTIIDFEDRQEMPNHMQLRLYPIATVGLSITFG